MAQPEPVLAQLHLQLPFLLVYELIDIHLLGTIGFDLVDFIQYGSHKRSGFVRAGTIAYTEGISLTRVLTIGSSRRYTIYAAFRFPEPFNELDIQNALKGIHL